MRHVGWTSGRRALLSTAQKVKIHKIKRYSSDNHQLVAYSAGARTIRLRSRERIQRYARTVGHLEGSKYRVGLTRSKPERHGGARIRASVPAQRKPNPAMSTAYIVPHAKNKVVAVKFLRCDFVRHDWHDPKQVGWCLITIPFKYSA